MVTVNVDIEDMLINGQVGEVEGFEIMNNIVKKSLSQALRSFSWRNAILSDHFTQENCFVPLQKYDADIPIC